MNETAILITVIGVTTIIAAIAIHYRFKQAHFELWVTEIEEVLEERVSQEDKDSILRDIYNEGVWSIRQSIILYKDAKNA